MLSPKAQPTASPQPAICVAILLAMNITSQNFHIGDWKLIDHPQLYGVVWLTLRGVLLTFLIGLATNSLLYMVWGAPMGIIYWLSGLFARKVKNDGKGGWYYSEWLYGAYLGLGCFLW